MNLKHNMRSVLLASVAVAVPLAFASAQVQSSTQTEHGPASSMTTVEKGTVAFVSGNYLVVKMADGEMRSFPNVPDSVKINVDGQMLGVHDLKPGMHLQRTITTTTTPRMVTKTETVTGKVWQVTPPLSVILTLQDGTNQRFSIPKGQQFNINGQMTDAFGLRRGMVIDATRVTEVPETVVATERKISGTMPPPPPPPPPADKPVLIVVVPHMNSTAPTTPAPAAAPAPAPAQTAEAAPPKALPKTGTNLPLFGVLGLLSLAAYAGLRVIRARSL